VSHGVIVVCTDRVVVHAMAHNAAVLILSNQLSPDELNPVYDRDFRKDANCPKGESRGGIPYHPPKGWCRHALNVDKMNYGGDKVCEPCVSLV
jgi:hypothetical protein